VDSGEQGAFGMRLTVKGVLYDSAFGIAKLRYRDNKPMGEGHVEEVAYTTVGGQYFMVREVDGEEVSLFTMSNEEMARWSAPDNKPGDFSPAKKR